MTKNVGAGPGQKKPGYQTRTESAGAGPRVNPPSLNDNSISYADITLRKEFYLWFEVKNWPL